MSYLKDIIGRYCKVGEGFVALQYVLPLDCKVNYRGLDSEYRKYWDLSSNDKDWYQLVENGTDEKMVMWTVDRLWEDSIKPDFIVEGYNG